jgi:hypothetical protein
VTGILLQPSYPSTIYYGQWTPRLAHLQPYDGQVTEAYLGPIEIGWRRLPNSAEVREQLHAAAPLHVVRRFYDLMHEYWKAGDAAAFPLLLIL